MASSRYQPIVDLLAVVPTVTAAKLDKAKIGALVVELYRLRNGFLHSGIHPYREDIDLGGVVVTTGRIVRGVRTLAKLAIADALGFPTTSEAKSLAHQVELLFEGGSFVPREVARRLAGHGSGTSPT